MTQDSKSKGEKCVVSPHYGKDEMKQLHFYCINCDKEMGYEEDRICHTSTPTTEVDNYLTIENRKVDNEKETNINDIEKFIAKLDWKGLAEAWHKGDIKWHAEEWKNFITKIQAQTKEETLKEVVGKVEVLWGSINMDDKEFYIKRSDVINLLTPPHHETK